MHSYAEPFRRRDGGKAVGNWLTRIDGKQVTLRTDKCSEAKQRLKLMKAADATEWTDSLAASSGRVTSSGGGSPAVTAGAATPSAAPAVSPRSASAAFTVAAGGAPPEVPAEQPAAVVAAPKDEDDAVVDEAFAELQRDLPESLTEIVTLGPGAIAENALQLYGELTDKPWKVPESKPYNPKSLWVVATRYGLKKSLMTGRLFELLMRVDPLWFGVGGFLLMTSIQGARLLREMKRQGKAARGGAAAPADATPAA